MRRKVLFVDDEADVLDALRRTLRAEPYEILTARSGSEALAVLEREAVDLIVSDELMPGITGTELLAQVEKRWPETTRIILSGHASLESAIRAINEGRVFRYLIKPCDALQFAQTIRDALTIKDLRDASRRLLAETSRQSRVLSNLEKDHPGITKVQKDAEGCIVVDEAVQETQELLARLNGRMGQRD